MYVYISIYSYYMYRSIAIFIFSTLLRLIEAKFLGLPLEYFLSRNSINTEKKFYLQLFLSRNVTKFP